MTGDGGIPPDSRKLGVATDIGKRREVDEDSVLAAEVAVGSESVLRSARLLAVADGMGGHARGEEASRMAISAIAREVLPRLLSGAPPAELLADGIRGAHRDVLAHVESRPEARGMGTTAVCALVRGGEAHLANIGDSRAYVVSPDGIRRVTRDHSHVQELVDAGEITEKEARTHPRKNVITKAIGATPDAEPDTMRLALEPEESLVLCCDGVTAHLTDEDIMDAVLNKGEPQEACDYIVNTANKRGGTDNISLVILGPSEG